MKYCINDSEGKLSEINFASCKNCLLQFFPSDICGLIDVCDLTHIISKSENTSPIFTL